MKPYFIFVIVFILFSCNNLFEENDNDKIVHKDYLSGYAQKGPYLNGSSITIYELDENLNQTGNTFVTQISNNTGSFTLNDLDLISQYVLLKVDGYYYNEVKGQNENAPLTLYAISDITDVSTLNVNIMTYLEKNRVEYLVNDGLGFSVAKDSAQKDLFRVFSINEDNISNSETLDMSQPSEGNAILLAISIILQSKLEIADFTELLANFINDFKEDGQINDSVMVKKLYQMANYPFLPSVRENLENRYDEIGITVEIPNFEYYIADFIESQNKDKPPVIVSDIDSNVYHVVHIGDQTWLKENLRVTHYRNGDPIPKVTDVTEWCTLTTGAYCYYDNDETNNETYGCLYNWYAVDDSRKIAPEGWHVPNDSEWTILTEFLGGEVVAGGKMKETGTTHWESPNTDAINESGFSALPGGYRGSNGSYYSMGSHANFWSSTEEGDFIDCPWARFRYLYYDNSEVGYGEIDGLQGISVRCVRD